MSNFRGRFFQLFVGKKNVFENIVVSTLKNCIEKKVKKNNFYHFCFKDGEKEETDFKGTINKGPKYGIVDPKMGFCVKILGKTSKKLKPSNFQPKFRSKFLKNVIYFSQQNSDKI